MLMVFIVIADCDDLKRRNALKEIGKTLQHIVTSFVNYMTYMEQRATLYPCDMSMEPLSSTTEEVCYLFILTSMYVE
jgi:hypothetical protein